MVALVWVVCVLAVCHVSNAQTCTGNGFVGGCADVFGRTGEPTGLAELVGSGSVTNVCEDDTIAVVHDCANRIPLYVTINLDRDEIDASNPGRCDSCDFVASTHLDASEQAFENDYDGANDRIPCYERESDGQLYRDQFWLDNVSGPDEQCFSSEPATGTSRGHMIADSYIRQTPKSATYHFTNCIPQYQKFNNEAWNIAEQEVYPWLQNHCGSAISDPTVRANAQALLMVGAVPSTGVTRVFTETDVSPRWFGEWGFGDGVFTSTVDYNGNTPVTSREYRVNMPAAMWTAVCCVATDENNNVAYVRHTAFGRDAKPVGNDNPVEKSDWASLMASMLPEYSTSGVDLFPSEPQCADIANYREL